MVTHPGNVLLAEMLERDLKLSELSSLLETDPEFLGDFLQGHADLTPELPAKLAKLIGTGEQFWKNLQANYDAEGETLTICGLSIPISQIESCAFSDTEREITLRDGTIYSEPVEMIAPESRPGNVSQLNT